MKKIIITILVLFLCRLNFAASGDRFKVYVDDSHDFECKIEVIDKVARFIFFDVLKTDSEKYLNHDGLDEAFELSWFVFFDEKFIDQNGQEFFQFNFVISYVFDRHLNKKISIEQILTNSRHFGYVYDEDYFYPMQISSSSITHEIEGRNLIILLHRNQGTKYFFDNIPQQGSFWILTKSKPLRCGTLVEK